MTLELKRKYMAYPDKLCQFEKAEYLQLLFKL